MFLKAVFRWCLVLSLTAVTNFASAEVLPRFPPKNVPGSAETSHQEEPKKPWTEFQMSDGQTSPALKECQFSLRQLVQGYAWGTVTIGGLLTIRNMGAEVQRQQSMYLLAQSDDLESFKGKFRNSDAENLSVFMPLLEIAVERGSDKTTAFLLKQLKPEEIGIEKLRELALSPRQNGFQIVKAIHDYVGPDPQIQNTLFHRALEKRDLKLAESLYDPGQKYSINPQFVAEHLDSKSLPLVTFLNDRGLLANNKKFLVVRAIRYGVPETIPILLKDEPKVKWELNASELEKLADSPAHLENFLKLATVHDPDLAEKLFWYAMDQENLRSLKVISTYYPIAEIANRKNYLAWTIRMKRNDASRYLLGIQGIDIHKQDETALVEAIRKGDAELVEKLVQLGANVKAGKNAPLRMAIKAGHPEIAQRLIDLGADPQEAAVNP